MSKLGSRFKLDVEKFKIRSFECRGHVFKVRIPTMGEINEYEELVATEKENGAAIQAIFDERRKGLEPSEEVIFEPSGKDIIVKGRSLFETSQAEHVSRIRITWLFNLLVKEVDDGQGDLTYEDIAAELPMQIQVELVDRIAKAMASEPEEVKKNSGATLESNSPST